MPALTYNIRKLAFKPEALRLATGYYNLLDAVKGAMQQLNISYNDSTGLETYTAPSPQGGGGGGAITTVFGRTGVVVAAANDYTFAQLASIPTTVAGYGITDVYTKTQSDNNYPLTTGSYSNPTWITALAWGKVTGAPAFITANQSISFAPTGDVTGSTSGTTTLAPAFTIGANAVTFAKMQTIPTVSLMGNSTGGSAVPQSITLGAGLAFSGTTLTATAGTNTITKGNANAMRQNVTSAVAYSF